MSEHSPGGGFRTLSWNDAEGALEIIDQTLLPREHRVVALRTVDEVCEAIRVLRVRGAPAIGCAAAYGLAVAARRSRARERGELLAELRQAADKLRATRPTAVNLFWAVERVLGAAQRAAGGVDEVVRAVVAEAQAIFDDDDRRCRAIGAHGAELVPDGANILTHCNAGGLATSGYGTAVGVIRAAHEQGKRVHVWVDETRPLLQGARLTAWELKQLGIPATLIADNMAATVMAQGKVDLVVVGADRIAANGDTANKIGTLGLAVLCARFAVPFYVAAPYSSIDLNIGTGAEIPIEERDARELVEPYGLRIAPELGGSLGAYNPAFDVTPHELIAAIITENGVLRPPYRERIRAASAEGT